VGRQARGNLSLPFHFRFTIHYLLEIELLTYILYGLFIFSCMVLVVVILLQPGKSGAGDLFSSNLSSTAFGPRGTASILAKITIGAAAAFMLIALMLSLPGITGSHSVLQSTEIESQPSPTQTPTPQATVGTTTSQSPPETASPATSPK
jgi:preprotein translocase subunit SecG